MKQTIEVEVGPEDDTGTCLVVLGGGARRERWDRNRVLDLGLTIPESEPEPPLPPEPRAEYALYRFNENGSLALADTEVKQTIEVEVGPEDDTGTCLVVLGGGARRERWDRDTVLDLGLTIPAEPEPERAECAFYRFDSTGSLALADEVLVPAHSLRAGDRVEWAPGDWREITDVEEHRLAITFWVDDEPFSRNRWDLVAVRR